MTYETLKSQLNPLTFPLLNQGQSKIVFNHSIDFLNNKKTSFSDKKEIFRLISAYIPEHCNDDNFLINYCEYFKEDSDFLVINMLKKQNHTYFISEDLASLLFDNYQYKNPVLFLIDSSKYSSVKVLLNSSSSLSLWDWLFEKTKGTFFTGSFNNIEQKECIYRFLYNNFYFNNDVTDKMLIMLSVIDILFSNHLVHFNDDDLYTLCKLYFNEGYGYFPHLNDNFIINKYTISDKQKIIYSEFLSLLLNDFYGFFKSKDTLLTDNLLNHIILLNDNFLMHPSDIKFHIHTHLEKSLINKQVRINKSNSCSKRL